MTAGPALSPEQMRAVRSDAPLLIVAAGAGTGKTTTLTARAARLRDMVLPEDSVLAVTFTVAAAREMRHRIESGRGDGNAGVDVRTLHSLAFRMCGEFGLLPRRSGWFLSDTEALEWLQDMSASQGEIDLPPGHVHPGESVHSALLRLFQRWGENDADLEGGVSSGALSFPPAVVALHGAFRARKRLEGRGDFSDLVSLATRHLLDGGEASRRGRYAHVLVDEAQDLNLGQIAFLRALCQPAESLTLVGDDDQSLYGFRGAVPNLLERAEVWFPELAARGTERIELREHRRCRDGVVRPALRVVNLNRRHSPKVLVTSRDGGAPRAFRFRDEREEAMFVAWRIDSLLRDGQLPEDIVVLARSSSAFRVIEAELIARRVAIARRDGAALLESAVARDALAWLSLVTAPDAGGALLRVHARPSSGVGRTTATRVVELCESSGLTVREAMLSLARTAGGVERDSLHAFVDKLDRLEECLSRAVTVRESVESVLQGSGYVEWLASQEKADALEDVEILLSIAETSSDLDDFLVTACVSQTDDWVGTAGRVSLMTLHGAKGLEWGHVFLVGAHGRALPHVMAVNEFEVVRSLWPTALLRSDPLLTIGRGGVEEERRLFHVGLTRARETVIITCPSSIRVMGKSQGVMPTPFLAEADISLSAPPDGWSVGAAAGRSTARKSVATWRRAHDADAPSSPSVAQMSLF